MMTDPDVSVDTSAATGLYVATVAIGLVSLLAVTAGVSSDAILALIPTLFTAGVLCGTIAARVNAAFTVRFGARRWRTAILCVPALAVAMGTAALVATDTVSRDWVAVVLGVSVGGIVASARLLSLATHDAFVGAAIDVGESLADWTWFQSGTNASMIGTGITLFSFAIVLVGFTGVTRLSVVLILASITFVALGWAPTLSLPRPDGTAVTLLSVSGLEYARADVHAYDAGVVVGPRFVPSYRRFIPWNRITDVRLTDDRLVLERRWRPDIRCDQSAIEDLDTVVDAIEAARHGTVGSVGTNPEQRESCSAP
ncbi:hypothetical protein [Natrinema sp. SYSU A 869]|uniref:hypothetical protein n=1 Tax=Natrinema sp. SYSU A 869 TaxID=2871694 RepID=UPI001CA44408|nr:hypothetical protein [Natrinema sp. SYSU A 869]